MSDTIIKARNVSVDIKGKRIIHNIKLDIKKGKSYSIIGPNGSGKTTLLRALSRNLKPSEGRVYLNGENLLKKPTKQVAREMAVLTQTHSGMNDVTVRQLISYGRFAHREWWKSKQDEDNEIVEECMTKTGIRKFADRSINTLSGGERQRAWIAMALAQKPQIILLDEPTTFLDISHQLEVLELVKKLNAEEGLTILMVLHDINHAARYSDEIIIIKEGNVFASGEPWDMLTPQILEEVFEVDAAVTKAVHMDNPVFYARSVVRKDSEAI